MSRRFVVRCLVVGGGFASTLSAARDAIAQGGSTPPASAATPNPFSPAASVKRVSVSKAAFGDAAVIVNARDDGYIEVAGAGPQKTIFLKVRTLAARAWVDSAARMLKARAKKSDPERTYRSDIAEYGTNTTLTLTRSVNAGESVYTLGFSESPQSSFTVPIEAEEADVFVAIIRKAAVQSAKMLEKTDTTAAAAERADSVARADSIAAAKKKKKPAAKRPASPPATDSTAKTAAPKTAAPKTPAPVKPPA